MTPQTPGHEWLAACAPDPNAVHNEWKQGRTAHIPAAWTVAESTLLHSLRAAEQLSHAGQLGPVLAHFTADRTWWLLPAEPETGTHLADLPQLYLHAPGWPLRCPAPGHCTEGMLWLQPPDGSGTLTDPAALGAAFGCGGRLPAEAFG